jgi:NADPH-dependent ferric siderophore reductase
VSGLRTRDGGIPRRAGDRNSGRRRPPPRPVEVVSVSKLTPRLVSVRLCGGGLEEFRDAAPTSHLKVYLPRHGYTEPIARTYTLRRFDSTPGILEVQFVLHGDGPASEWAAQAKPGDRLAVAGPGGKFIFDPGATRWWIGGDESALPAVGTLLEALPATANAEVHLEVDGADDEIVFQTEANVEVRWHHRRSPHEFGKELHDSVRRSDISNDVRVWVACEAIAARRIRRHLVEDSRLAIESIVTRGYWSLGLTNYHE